MQCETVRPLLYRLLDDGLLVEDADGVRAHVAGCTECGRRLQRIAALDESVMEAESEQPPSSLRPKLMTAYRRAMADRRAASSPPRRWMPVMRRAAVIALVALGSGTATWLGLSQGGSRFDRSSSAAVAPVSLDHLFPLRLDTPYTIVHEDGRLQEGVRIDIVQ